jgi:3-(3-hydroxy-phenyl)propionate hydroxylase
VNLSDDVLGPGFALIGFGADPSTHLDAASIASLQAAGGRILHFGKRDSGAPYEDLDGTLINGSTRGHWAALVRPDRIVFHDGPIAESSRIVREGLTRLGHITTDKTT